MYIIRVFVSKRNFSFFFDFVIVSLVMAFVTVELISHSITKSTKVLKGSDEMHTLLVLKHPFFIY